ncbi:MAG: hypothetical protein ABIE70_12840 [bacterium]
MKTKIGTAMLLVLAILTAATFYPAHAQETFDISKYLGNWRGCGEAYIPYLGTSLAFDGKASFHNDSTGAYVRTAASGQALLLTYADSGRFVIDPASDSITWDIWDNFGRYSQYHGVAQGDMLKGKQKRGSLVYTMITRFLSSDSIVVTISTTDSEGVVTERAKINLGRER